MKKIINHPFHKTSVAKFLYSGVFMRGFAFVLNFIFADLLELNIRYVYFFIMVLDFFIGFTISRFYVFTESYTKTHRKAFVQFIVAGISFRVADWLFYILLVEKVGLYILFAQFLSMACIVVLKYIVHKKIFN